jgi:transcriptional regulator with XRE-family HTH domain
MARVLKRSHKKVCLLRAFSGLSVRGFAKAAGINHTLIVKYEGGVVEPRQDHLERMARAAGFTLDDAEELLQLAESMRLSRRREGGVSEDALSDLVDDLWSVTWHLKALGVANPDDIQRPAALWAGLDVVERPARLKRNHYMARVLRALSGLSQQAFGNVTGIDSTLISRIEDGSLDPSHEQLVRMGKAAGFTLADAEEIVLAGETMRLKNRSQGGSSEDALRDLVDDLWDVAWRGYMRLHALPIPEEVP